VSGSVPLVRLTLGAVAPGQVNLSGDEAMANNKVLHVPTKPIVMRPPDVLGDPHPLSKFLVPPKSIAYTVKDGDSWESVAKSYGLSAKALIDHNFQTTVPAYVNYYLKHITGCNKTYDDINAYLPVETQMYVPKIEATLRKREARTLRDLNLKMPRV
jgi:hypothetical protein